MINRILVAEDNLVTQQIMKALLEGKCNAVSTASRYQDIIDLLSSDIFQVLLLDFHLDHDADYVIKAIRNLDSENKNINIYVLSAEREADIMKKLSSLSIQGFLQKPVEADLLYKALSIPVDANPGNPANQSRPHESYLKSILGDNQDRINSVTQFFIDEVPPGLINISSFLKEKNYASARSLVHRIRPAYTYIGRDDIQERLSDWEEELSIESPSTNYQAQFDWLAKETKLIIDDLNGGHPTSQPSLPPKKNPILSSLKGKKILIVDDNAVIISAFTAFLNSHGIIATHAGNGVESLLMIISQEPDLIMMDIHMPEMNGLEAIRTIRDKGITVPLFAMSNLLKYEQVAIDAGANIFLHKPIDGNVLLEKITAFLNRE